jgi:hypothetical protein
MSGSCHLRFMLGCPDRLGASYTSWSGKWSGWIDRGLGYGGWALVGVSYHAVVLPPLLYQSS